MGKTSPQKAKIQEFNMKVEIITLKGKVVWPNYLDNMDIIHYLKNLYLELNLMEMITRHKVQVLVWEKH
jgi:hypothetical protein